MTENSENLLGNYLKDLRKSHSYTQEAVASYLNVIRQSYSHYETGRTRPGIETLNQIAKLYHVPLDTLLALQLKQEIATGELRNIPRPTQELTTDDIPLITEAQKAGILSNISAKEIQLLISFRRLSETDQQDFLDFIKIKAGRK